MVAPEDDDDASKTEEPSERKISKAKEEGEVAISQEAKSFIMLLGMLFVVFFGFAYFSFRRFFRFGGVVIIFRSYHPAPLFGKLFQAFFIILHKPKYHHRHGN